MRVRHCVVRAIIRQPWLVEDPDALATALVRLAADAIAARLPAQLDRIGQTAPLTTVAIRLALPIRVVLELAGSLPTSPQGRRLPSFTAELAVHTAVSDGLRNALEHVAAEFTEPAGGGAGTADSPAATSKPAPAGGAVAGNPALGTARHGEPSAGELAGTARDRRARAVVATLRAAWRRRRLPELLRRAGPALLAEWLELLQPAVPGSARQPAGWPDAGRQHRATARQDATAAAGGPDLEAITGAVVRALRRAPGEVLPALDAASPAPVTLGPRDSDLPPPARVDAQPSTGTSTGPSPPTFPGQGQRDPAAADRPDPYGGEPQVNGGGRPAPEPGRPAAATASAPVPAASPTRRYEPGEPVNQGGGPVASPAGGSPPAWHAPAEQAAELGPLPVPAAAAPAPDGPPGWPGAVAPPAPADRDPARPAAGGLRTALPSLHSVLRVAPRDLAIASVLPFLLLGPLDDLGVLDAVAAALAGPGRTDLLAAFAAGLARKVLPPPAAGWLQPPEVIATVAAFAGEQDAPAGATVERLGRAVPHWSPVVDHALTAALVELHAPASPLVVGESAGGFVIADADGLMPLCWDADEGTLGQLWADCDRPPLVARPALAPALCRFGAEPDQATAERLADLVGAMGERPASGRAGFVPELDAPLDLLCGVALAVLSWTLWSAHERTDPVLAIRRLGDLDGRVRVDADRVTVRMPLGRRHADLGDSGLLRTLDGVPWLQGRRLELVGG